METIYVNKFSPVSSTNGYTTTLNDYMIPWYQNRFSKYSNLTYVGMAVSSNMRDAVFQIGSNENYKFAMGSSYNANNNGISIGPFIRNASTDLTSCTHLGNNRYEPSARTSWPQNNALQYSFYLYTISDTDGNLEAVWTPNPTYSLRDQSNPLIFVKTANGRDAIVQFSSGTNALNLFYLDDDTHTNYYINQDTASYSGNGDVVKSNYLPIVTAANGINVVDIINTKLIRILNVNIDSVYSSSAHNNSAFVRKLIRVGNTYYRQLVTNWWFEDPKGDEEIEIDDDTAPSS